MNLSDLKIKIDAAYHKQLTKELKELPLPQTGPIPFLFGIDLATESFGSSVVIAIGQVTRHQEDVYQLMMIIGTMGYPVSYEQMDEALAKTGIDEHALYYDFSAGEETERVIALTEALGLPQHALIGRGIEIKGKVVEADKESVRWLRDRSVGIHGMGRKSTHTARDA